MEEDLQQLPPVIFGLRHDAHRVRALVAFLKCTGATVMRQSRKARLLSQVAAQERTLFTPYERDQISRWFIGDSRISIADILSPIFEYIRFVTLECTICMASLESYFFPQGKLAEGCDHKSSICIRCLRKSLDQEIKEKAWDHVACPECPARLDFDTVKRFASAESFGRYDQNSVLAAFEMMPNFMMCLGPNCESGQLHEGGDEQPIMTCTTCKFKSCFVHKMPWHSGLTCGQYDAEQEERTRQEEASTVYIKQKTKACPNATCGLNLDKYVGCDHVTCTKCGYEFCWICFVSYEDIRRVGNSAHKSSCKWHTTHLPVLANTTLNIPETHDNRPLPLRMPWDD